MKVLLPILALGVALSATAKNEVYQTPNNATVYTFEALSQIPESGVTKTGDLTYTVTKDIEVPVKDGIKITNNMTLLLGPDVLIKIYGINSDFAPADTATIKPTETGVTPKGIQFIDIEDENHNMRTLEVKHIRFEGAGLKVGGPSGVVVENCTFFEHNDKIGHYAINYAGSGVGNVVRNCYFLRSKMSAIGSVANIAAGTIIEDNVMEDCSTNNRNYPVINQTVGGDNGPIVIRRNKILGGKRTMPGAISVSNMLSLLGENKVVIEDNYMDNSRYGINIFGNYMDATVTGNTVLNCHYETNANNGGSGMTVYSTKAESATKVYASRNRFEGCLWGVTIIGQTIANLGNLTVDPSAPDYNPGQNIFKNNGNCGTTPDGAETAFDPSNPYDLYNNTPNTVYAQGNTWGSAAQTKEEIEKYIFHSVDDSNLGEVIFMPAGSQTSGIDSVDGDSFTVNANADGTITVSGVAPETPVAVYDVAGAQLFNGTADTAIALNRRGLVIVVVADKAVRLAL